jgi:hypothetical protein
MRRLSKGPKPQVLADNEAAWAHEYATAAGTEKKPRRWRHEHILDGLRSETLGKCAYCEGIISDVSFDQVEHILPKSKRPDLVVQWSNLTIACPRCNNAKLDYYDPAAPLVHPYEDDPGESLEFRGPAVFGKLGADAGERTVHRIRLMREPLLIERLRRIEHLHGLIRRWDESSGSDREFREQAVRDALGDDAEFTTCLQAEALAMGFPV